MVLGLMALVMVLAESVLQPLDSTMLSEAKERLGGDLALAREELAKLSESLKVANQAIEISRREKEEVLDLMVRMLGFSEEDKQRIGFAQSNAGKGVVRDPVKRLRRLQSLMEEIVLLQPYNMIDSSLNKDGWIFISLLQCSHVYSRVFSSGSDVNE
ncbi:hypothetical protein E2562_034162 [Oryza meyeriana var. granulata]|uniref:Uncharacterized protein n=1 Tax=Oryza meyeriana var. granulata TaxID=110450 RepID=A0A6G1ESH3_9ORYZ|nr:hypothetical protein E2562_034162 [Oryza meyeriana var. granulata]